MCQKLTFKVKNHRNLSQCFFIEEYQFRSTFFVTLHTPILNIQSFPLDMLIFRQKSFQFCTSAWKLNNPYYHNCKLTQIVCPFSTFWLTPVKPFFSWKVLKSHIWIRPSRQVANNLFISISFLSKASPQIPFSNWVSQRTDMARKSNILRSPLS